MLIFLKKKKFSGLKTYICLPEDFSYVQLVDAFQFVNQIKYALF